MTSSIRLANREVLETRLPVQRKEFAIRRGSGSGGKVAHAGGGEFGSVEA